MRKKIEELRLLEPPIIDSLYPDFEREMMRKISEVFSLASRR